MHSTETAALEFLDRTIQILDRGNLPISIFLDLSKAFDTLDHHILCKNLEYYGIIGTALHWFSNYLENRSQFVLYDNVCSKPLPIKTGFHKDPYLDLFFLLFIQMTCTKHLPSSNQFSMLMIQL